MKTFRPFLASLLFSAVVSTPAIAQTFLWTGEGATNNWSERDNWLSPSPPQEGGNPNIRLEFLLASSNFTPNNNLAETNPFDPRFGAFQLESMFLVAPSTNPYTITGDPLLFAGDASIASDTVGGPNVINNALRIAVPLEVSASGQLELNGNLSGTANIAKTGGGTLVLDGANGDWSGNLSINQGTVRFDPGDALSVNSDLHVAEGATADFSPEAEGFGGFSGGGHLEFGNNIDMFSHFNNTETFSGTISGANTHLRKQGPEALILDGVVAGPADVTLDRLTLEAGSINLTPNAVLNIDADLSLEPGTILTASGDLNLSTLTIVTVEDGAQLRVRTPTLRPADIGIEPGGMFEVLSGATVAIDGGTFHVLSAEDLFIDTGAKLILQNGVSAIVGAGNSPPLSLSLFAELEVTGEGTTLSGSGGLLVGDFGTGAMTIADGGSVSTSINAKIGARIGSTGTVTVTGEGSTWSHSGTLLEVGLLDDGTLTIEDGGRVESVAAFVGSSPDDPNASGTVTVTGPGSEWASSDNLFVGLSGGAGTLRIEDGGSVSNQSGEVGANEAIGNVTVIGADGDGNPSTWNNSALLAIGSQVQGNGTMTIAEGGSVSSDGGSIGRSEGSTGTVTLTGAGSTWTITSGLSVGGTTFGQNGGTGTLNIQPGSEVSVAEDIVLFPDGLVRLEGGTLAATEINFDGGGQFEFLSGTLHVERFLAPLQNHGGTLAPGLSAGSTTVVGGYVQQADATLQIEIGGMTPGTEFDVLTIEPLLSSDDALLDGTLEVSLIDDFMPALGDSFTIVETTAGNVIGTFADDILPVFNGLTFDVVYNPQSVMLEVVESTGLAGDYNSDGTVDAADYTTWRDNLGAPAGALPNDTDGGPIGQAQYDTWVANFGASAGFGSELAGAAVPEPSTWLLLATALAWLGVGCRWSRVG